MDSDFACLFLIQDASLQDPGRYRITDPDFDDPFSCVHPSLIDDWLSILAAENAERIAEANELDGIFLTSQAVQYVFTVCVRLRLPQEVKFAAVAIFDQ